MKTGSEVHKFYHHDLHITPFCLMFISQSQVRLASDHKKVSNVQ
jgi:hypothetical protein